MKKISVTACLLLLATGLFGQSGLPDLKDVQKVVVKNYWGDQKIKGISRSKGGFKLSAVYTDTSKKQLLEEIELMQYVTLYKEKGTLYVLARQPKGFESIDLNLQIPSDLQVVSELFKGGNIFMENLDKGVEINSLNGSVKLRGIAGYALVSAANGEVDIEFDRVDPSKPISLITLNGGVSVTLPDKISRDVRLISRKNGYVLSQFPLGSDRAIKNLNKMAYSKTPIIASATINGGGSLLFLSTQNGPLAIKKLN
ncbi:MAG: hypothetical protein KJP14_02865 [Eudoraea sp.]|nr:hypothetical protein [Eudoraea sp.]